MLKTELGLKSFHAGRDLIVSVNATDISLWPFGFLPHPLRCLRRSTRGGEDRAVVSLEYLEPAGEVTGVVRTRGDRQAEVTAKEG